MILDKIRNVGVALKKICFPVEKGEWILFSSMLLVVSLINVNFTILRSLRNTLVVADQGGSVAFIPYFELFGTFPASILLTWALSRLMRFFSFRSIFSITTIFFLTFFLAFAFWIYPHRQEIYALLENTIGFWKGSVVLTHWPDLLFYIMSELWKVALLSVIFWGFLNQHLTLDQAKRFYPPLLLGSSIGPVLAGPITVFSSSLLSWNFFPVASERWQHTLYLLTFFLVFSGVLALGLFYFLCKRMGVPKRVGKSSKTQDELEGKVSFSRRLLSLSSSLKFLAHSSYLRSLLLIVVAEYICYGLGELMFLECLKDRFPLPSDYCQYMGSLSTWMGILTAFFALVLAPYLFQKYRWKQTILITPILMVGISFAFFAMIYLSKTQLFFGFSPLNVAIMLGSLHYCIGRAAKYTLFDAVKEVAFVPLDADAQMKGKLVIDGIGSRLGRGGSSFLSIVLFLVMGGPGESVLMGGALAVFFALVMLPAASRVGKSMDAGSQREQRMIEENGERV